MPREYHDGRQDGLIPVVSLNPDEIHSFSDLLQAMGRTSFGGRRLGEAFDVMKEMVLDPDCYVVATFSGACPPRASDIGCRGEGAGRERVVANGLVCHPVETPMDETRGNRPRLQRVDRMHALQGESEGQRFRTLCKGLQPRARHPGDGSQFKQRGAGRLRDPSANPQGRGSLFGVSHSGTGAHACGELSRRRGSQKRIPEKRACLYTRLYGFRIGAGRFDLGDPRRTPGPAPLRPKKQTQDKSAGVHVARSRLQSLSGSQQLH